MKNLLAPYSNEPAQIIFEYTIPRLGKRIDVVVLLRERVFVVEFKAGEEEFKHQDVDQVLDYALDLKNFHQGSADRCIIPILVATEETAFSTLCQPSHYDDGIYEPLLTNAAHLKDVFELVLSQPLEPKHYAVSLDDWSRSRYAPTPTIIEAARSLYLNHSVENITKSEAEGAQLETTTRYVRQVIRDTKACGGKSICFVTGVPGAGKTLVGLNVAVQQEKQDLAVYLSGNGPLVQVLTEALTRDKQVQEKENGKKITKKEAEREVKRFIQIIHRYRDNMLNKVKVVNGTLEIDPTKELKDQEKKGFANFPMSEGEFLIWSLDQRPDWAVIVCLVGGGQEINTGEAGIGEWIRALNETFPKWKVYISSQLTAKEYAEGKVSELLENNPNKTFSNDLHLAVSMRSFRAESLSNMVHYLLDGDAENVRKIYTDIADRYPIALTRDLNKAKEWLRTHARGNERYGLLVSSKAYRLKPLAIDVRCKPDTVHWFLDDINDVRSSLFLEDAASEFDVQGLELDWTCVVWDGDLRYTPNGWNFFEFNGGNKWNNIKKSDRQAYLINAYRVYYNRTYYYLKDLGLNVI